MWRRGRTRCLRPCAAALRSPSSAAAGHQKWAPIWSAYCRIASPGSAGSSSCSPPTALEGNPEASAALPAALAAPASPASGRMGGGSSAARPRILAGLAQPHLAPPAQAHSAAMCAMRAALPGLSGRRAASGPAVSDGGGCPARACAADLPTVVVRRCVSHVHFRPENSCQHPPRLR